MSAFRSLTNDDYTRLYSVCEALIIAPRHIPANHAIQVLIMLLTGIRVGELSQLLVSDLFIGDTPVTSLRVRAEIAKTKKERTIPISSELSGLLKLWYMRHHSPLHRDGSYWLFPGRGKTGHVSTRQIERSTATISTRALGRAINPHRLRHTFATRLLKVSNTRIVQVLLGHKSLQSTQIYTHPDGEQLQQAIDRL